MSKSDEKKRLTIYLEYEDYEEIGTLSKIYEWSKSRIAEKLIKKGLEQEKKGNKIR
jgi:hypothetical protein